MGGDDCDRPACDDTKSALSAALKRVDRRRTDGDALSLGYRRACPPTRDEIGAQTWSLLHSMVRVCMNDISIYSCFGGSRTFIHIFICCASEFKYQQAAWYPNKPTSEDELFMSTFMVSLARFYPCTYCASDFQRAIQTSPPRYVHVKSMEMN